jgi:hypothetical protein
LELSAQTYTTNGNCSDWTNGACWTKVNIPGCNQNSNSLFPPFTTNVNGCDVSVIVRHPINVSGNRTFDGDFRSITVDGDVKLTFAQNVTIGDGRSVEFVTLDRGRIEVAGQLALRLGPGQPGSAPTRLDVSGDGTGEVFAQSIDINNRVELNVCSSGALALGSQLNHNGNSFALNISGVFKAPGVRLRGAFEVVFVANLGSQVTIDGDLNVNGAVVVNFEQQTTIFISEDIEVVNVAQVLATNSASVFVFGEYPEPNTNGGTAKEENGEFFPCVFLPVDFLSFAASLSDDRRSVVADWSIASESSSSHFEVEYSLTGLDGFGTLGGVEAAGYTTETQHYRLSAPVPAGAEGMIYLRIRQVDLKGSFSYTELLSLRLPTTPVAEDRWQVFPNPTSGDGLRIRYNGRLNEAEGISARILSFSHAATILASDVQSLSIFLAEAIKQAPKGMYVLELTVGTEVSRRKVIKQ